MGKTHDDVIEMIKGNYSIIPYVHICLYVCTYIYYCFVWYSGNSHVALTLLCRSLGTNGTNTIGLSPPMAAGAAKGRMYMCVWCLLLYMCAESQKRSAQTLE